jgi:hypothetical protein
MDNVVPNGQTPPLSLPFGLNLDADQMEAFDKIIKDLLEHISLHGPNSNMAYFAEQIQILRNHHDLLSMGTSDEENFWTLGQIETQMMTTNRRQKETNLKFLLENMKRVKGEESFINKKKNDLLNLGVKVRKYRYLGTSIMTLVGRVAYERMALIPSTFNDAEKLKQLGIKGHIFPLDEALGMDRLPFKMTVASMAEVCKEATRAESFEDTEKLLKERTDIRINDDTIRSIVTSTGTRVFEQEKQEADKLWSQLEAGKLILPEAKIDHTFYIEVDGVLVPTREEGKKGTIFRENKLGEVFSSDNFLWWFDKHGERQHRILKRDYTALIGDNVDFTKLIFALALRNGYGKYKRTVLISDGATWIRTMKNAIFPDAQQILDFYHLCVHITDYTKIIVNNDEIAARKLSEKISNLFKEGHKEEAIDLIKLSSKSYATDALNSLMTYINNNIDNIDYAKYRAKNFFIGSGAIESSNRVVIQRRMKNGPMRWNVESGQAMATLLAKSKSDHWEDQVVNPMYEYYGEPNPNLLK